MKSLITFESRFGPHMMGTHIKEKVNVTNTDSNLEVERNYTVFVTNNNWQKIADQKSVKSR